jgi:hypothetical protein
VSAFSSELGVCQRQKRGSFAPVYDVPHLPAPQQDERADQKGQRRESQFPDAIGLIDAGFF